MFILPSAEWPKEVVPKGTKLPGRIETWSPFSSVETTNISVLNRLEATPRVISSPYVPSVCVSATY